MGLLAAVGLAVLFYPAVSRWYNDQYQIEAVAGYDDYIGNLSEQVIEQELEKAREYNRLLSDQTITDPFMPGGMTISEDYAVILDSNNGIMGSILIPDINVSLPIYHGTGEDVLKKGVGHMEMTPFPIGGTGNHSVLTGHTALPDARLFSDLNKLKEGQIFYISIYQGTLAYQIDQISVITPDDTALLVPDAGQDYVTLITCTPYGVNSHRLLVRGTRIPYEEAGTVFEEEMKDSSTEVSVPYDLTIALVMLGLVLSAFAVALIRRIGKEKGGSGNRE